MRSTSSRVGTGRTLGAATSGRLGMDRERSAGRPASPGGAASPAGVFGPRECAAASDGRGAERLREATVPSRLRDVFIREVPVDDVPERLDELGARGAVVDVVGVLPDVQD